ncbi:Something about silencing 10 [Chlorella sorokiniana]|uniref:Something about silencing 10 n=1 Tax=Chlorella sorokiniana TaxID=3076 RepID=A0A2P6TMG0_CHLSO|nr:Something about silencing 10 [Chlorella sorokiniana]|eukprot:PRW45524.1 Something about silencing 10 [Chlorella sorokiniana]
MAKQRPRRGPAPKRAARDSPELPSDMEDAIEKHHKARDKLPLDINDDVALSDDSLDEDEVLGLGGGSSDERGSSDEGEFEDTDDEIEAETKYGRLAKQAKALEAKLRIQRGEEEEEGEEDEGEGGRKRDRQWGASKRAYYGADLADLEGSEEEEDMKDEEEEALRLQREAAAALRPEDYGQSEGSSSEEEEGSSEEESDEEGPTLGRAAAAGGAVVERVAKDLSSLTREQRLAAVQQDAPELLQLIAELREGLTEVRSRVGPLLKEVREGELATAEGVSYLEAKHLLLLHYCTAIVFYLLLKAEGRPVQSHPVIQRLVEIRAYLEKIRPIDKKLQYQIEKLLKAAAATAGAAGGAADGAADGGEAAAALGGGDALAFGPRPDALVSKRGGAAAAAGGEEEGGAAGGVYRPPRLNPVSMELDEKAGELSARERRQLVQAQRRAQRSGFVQELAAELAGAPEEQRMAAAGLDTAAALRERQRLAAREDVEEELFIRVPMSKEERKRLKAHRRDGLSGKALLDDFADEVADIVGGGEGASAIDAVFQRHRASQKFGADLEAQALAAARKGGRSGDADLPSREPLYERRAKFDSVRARQQAALDEDEGPEELGGRGGGSKRREREEDDFYQEAKAAAAAKKSKRKEAYTYAETLPPAEDPTAAGARGITRDIEKNRGLTPHRRKDIKNPRKKHRMKYAAATVRRKGQVQEVRSGGGAAYGGEATGIKARVSKSVRL